jgi:uncharacterized protein YukE
LFLQDDKRRLGMSAPIIRVITEVLFASSDKIGNLGGQISSSVSELSSALDGIRGAYDGQLEAAVGSRVAQAQGAGNNMAGRVSESSADLARRASAFDAADNASMQDIVVGNQTVRDWTDTDLTFTQYGRLQSGSTPMLANYLNLGNLSGPFDSPSAQLNRMVVPGSGFQSRDVINGLTVIKPFLPKNSHLGGAFSAVTDSIEFLAGDHSFKSAARIIGKEGLEKGIEVVVGGGTMGYVMAGNAAVQLVGKADINVNAGLAMMIDPTSADEVRAHEQFAEEGLGKIDLGKIEDDLVDVMLKPQVTAVKSVVDAWNHPSAANILHAGTMVLAATNPVANSMMMTVDSKYKADVMAGTSKLAEDAGNFVVGVPQTAIGVRLVELDLQRAVGKQLSQAAAHAAQQIQSQVVPTVENAVRDTVIEAGKDAMNGLGPFVVPQPVL